MTFYFLYEDTLKLLFGMIKKIMMKFIIMESEERKRKKNDDNFTSI